MRRRLGQGLALLAAALGGCAMPEAVRRADTALARGDEAEAEALYRKALEDTYLTRSELAHVLRPLRELSSRRTRRQLEEMEARLAEGPVEEVLAELSGLRAEQARRMGDPAQDGMLLEAMRRVAARAWPQVEALARGGRNVSALKRARELAIFFPLDQPIWREVSRLEQSFRESPVDVPELGEPPFDPPTEEHLRLALESVQRDRPHEARGHLARGWDASGMAFEDYANRLILLYGLDMPLVPKPLPPAPEVPESVKRASEPVRLEHGRVGRTRAGAWEGLPTEDRLAARGFASVELAGEGLTLSFPDIPTQPDRSGLFLGLRMTGGAWLAHGLGGWGWVLHDEYLLELFLGLRTSPAHEYPAVPLSGYNREETGFCFGGAFSYALLGGWRGPHVGLLLGVRAQYTGYQVGDVKAEGMMLPMVARLELRWNERYPFRLEAWDTLGAGEEATRGMMLQAPVGGTWSLHGRYEALRLEATMGGLNRKDRVALGSRASRLFSLGFSTAF
ncbi:MAG: hypothetical protein JXB05_07215 [Myxococcaceae bacterium]|nr:hypothetical protein [Myxococcaceae bacterium]